MYGSIFSENLTAEHIILTYSLARAIDDYKVNLQQKSGARIEIEEAQYKFLSKRGSKMLLLFAISKCMEVLHGMKIINHILT